MRTQEEIDRQVAGLLRQKENLPEYNAFGDNNWAQIDIQIDVITGRVRFDDMEMDYELIEEGGDDTIYPAADAADYWLNNDAADDLFED